MQQPFTAWKPEATATRYPGLLSAHGLVLRRVQRHSLRQQHFDRSLDLEPERPRLLVARLSGLRRDVLQRIGATGGTSGDAGGRYPCLSNE